MIFRLLGAFVVLTTSFFLQAPEPVDKQVAEHVQFLAQPGDRVVPVLPVYLTVKQVAGEPFKSGEVLNCSIYERSFGTQNLEGETRDVTEIVAKCKKGKEFVVEGVIFEK